MTNPLTPPPYRTGDLVIAAIPEDERLWVPQAENIWFRPLMFNTVQGEWVNLLRVKKSGILSRHRHPAPVHGYVLKGSWRYLEHDWVARQGMYVFEPPGEVHTLICDQGDEEMITLFHVCGALIYCDEKGVAHGFDDVHTKIDMCRKHFEAVGLGADFVENFIR
ncbi:MAG: 2,4'-dihydroxyacetophenone dioxygenase family protein [Planctomycetaceae bacterium]